MLFLCDIFGEVWFAGDFIVKHVAVNSNVMTAIYRKDAKKDFDKLGECTYNEGRQFRIPSRKRRKRG